MSVLCSEELYPSSVGLHTETLASQYPNSQRQSFLLSLAFISLLLLFAVAALPLALLIPEDL